MNLSEFCKTIIQKLFLQQEIRNINITLCQRVSISETVACYFHRQFCLSEFHPIFTHIYIKRAWAIRMPFKLRKLLNYNLGNSSNDHHYFCWNIFSRFQSKLTNTYSFVFWRHQYENILSNIIFPVQ